MVTSEEGTLDDLYFEWLYRLIGSVKNRNPARSHWNLARQLYQKPFTWFIPNDDNREGDGKDLRDEFIDECDIQDIEIMWLDLDCSMLEMLIALSRRAAFETSGEPAEWFWRTMEHLDLRKYTDAVYDSDVIEHVDEVLERVINRTYDRDGNGGLFPLDNAREDQRRVEIWYQLSAFLSEEELPDNPG